MRRIKFVVILIVLVATFVPGIAEATCSRPKEACLAILRCLQHGVPNDVGRIREGLRKRVGHEIWAGADACWTNFAKQGEQNALANWARDTAGCLGGDYIEAAQLATNNCQ
jgi:hypothetical protein